METFGRELRDTRLESSQHRVYRSNEPPRRPGELPTRDAPDLLRAPYLAVAPSRPCSILSASSCWNGILAKATDAMRQSEFVERCFVTSGREWPISALLHHGCHRAARTPSIVKSSSRVSQRSARPRASIRISRSCSSVASRKRRNLSAGNAISRPSSSSTRTLRPSIHARMARTPPTQSTYILMPLHQKLFTTFLGDRTKPCQTPDPCHHRIMKGARCRCSHQPATLKSMLRASVTRREASSISMLTRLPCAS